MTALDLISLINQLLFVGLFVVVVRHALRERTRAALDTALLFGSVAGTVAVTDIAELAGLTDHPAYPGIAITILAVAPFAMVRLVDDFSDSPAVVQVGSAAGFVLVAALAVAAFGAMPALVGIAAIAYYLAAGGYATWAFSREAARSRGLTQRRMTAVAAGSLAFIAAVVLGLSTLVVAPLPDLIAILGQLAGLVAAAAFFFGFAPPRWLRNAWREPDLRRFLERSIHLAAVTDERSAMATLSAAAADAFGAGGATIGLAEPERGKLRYIRASGDWIEFPDDQLIGGRAYTQNRRLVVRDAEAADPAHAEIYRGSGARAVIAAPVATENRRIGVLTVFSEHMSLFTEDDLWLIDLLANQCAVLLEARALAEHASALRAREEAARLKEEFLSAAAHDLRTPLTVVLGQAELLERRRQRNPDAPADAQGLARIAREARRLSDLVTELLDAQRLGQGGAALDLVPGDLLDVVEDVRERYAEGGVTVTADEPALSLVAAIDRPRIEQVLDNLVENALKYTPNGEPPEIRVATVGSEARMAVVDHGIGIPEADRGRIFERFFRASNAQDITDTGLGLGLYICRRIVEEHDGRIWFEPTPGGGTTFAIALPLLSVPERETDADAERRWDAGGAREATADA